MKGAARKRAARRRSWLPGLGGVLALIAAVPIAAWFLNHRLDNARAERAPRAFDPIGVFKETNANPGDTTAVAPDGMAWIPGGEFSMGAQDPPDMTDVGRQATRDARPIHRVYVDGFWMDRTDVTNADFLAFVRATGYITIAERTPRAQDGGVVFSPPDHAVPLDNPQQWWSYVHGADWRHPEGPRSSITGREGDPVVQIAYEDADAYARWAGKRLPTEAEWEFAARGGLTGQPFVWGAQFIPGGRSMANTFQGHFPDHNSNDDGYQGLSPVRSFPPNGYGLYDMAGNVWQWVSDWYRPDYYTTLARTGGVARNPHGPETPFDPDEPAARTRVMRGGSFLCTDQYCARYMVGSRGKRDADTGTNHLGFRCVRDA